MGKFGLELHPEKTRLIEFGRYAAERRREAMEKGNRRPLTFLGFTHICGKNRTTGYFQVYRKTIGKRMAAKLKKIQGKAAASGCTRRSQGHGIVAQSVVRGYFQYHAVPGNEATTESVSARSAATYGCGSFGGGVSEAAGPGSVFRSDSES